MQGIFTWTQENYEIVSLMLAFIGLIGALIRWILMRKNNKKKLASEINISVHQEEIVLKNGNNSNSSLMITIINPDRDYVLQKAILKEKRFIFGKEIETNRGGNKIEKTRSYGNPFQFRNIQTLNFLPEKKYQFVMKFRDNGGHNFLFIHEFKVRNFGGRWALLSTGKQIIK